ncbi:hypothetical protein NW762_008876 [Fusarium torreyae]|uniref:Uncharacterized protein n=1 Tax=Fusarium torreyae TaxID=1237075 RepID=A0A9W8RUQ6_9HYPO|nr:hypothetical protein NW762_008876 [Fusarium torreyae]
MDKRAMFIIEADPDYAADFALTLAAITTFAGSMTKTRADVRIRVATMSWGIIHDVTQALFRHWAEQPQLFMLPQVAQEPIKMMTIPATQTGIEALDEYARTLDLFADHFVLRFREHDNSWNTEHAKLDKTREFLDFWWPKFISTENSYALRHFSEISTRRMFNLAKNTRAPNRLASSDHFSVLTSKTCRRVIFDRRTRQIVEVPLWCSLSERKQQMSWINRTETPRSNVVVLTRPGFLDDGCPPRRMRVLDDQVGGFIAALTEFVDWPKSFDALAIFIKARKDKYRIMDDMRRRLVHQDLAYFDRAPFGLSLKIQNRQAFYAMLPLVQYDYHIASFLCIPSSSPFVTMVKAQFASVLTRGVPDLFKIDPKTTGLSKIHICLTSECNTGVTGPLTGLGTIWTGLALAKSAARRVTTDMPPGSTISFAKDSIQVFPASWQRTHDPFEELCITLRINRVFVEELAHDYNGSELGETTAEQYVKICEHLLQAYGHQVAVVTRFTEEGLPEMQDFLSKQPIRCGPQVSFALNWSRIRKTANGEQVVGIYTRMIRGLTGRNGIMDWTWIPSIVWRKWKARLDSYQGWDSLTAIWPTPWFEDNEDESPGVQLQL